jgi:hypothetical protein
MERLSGLLRGRYTQAAESSWRGRQARQFPEGVTVVGLAGASSHQSDGCDLPSPRSVIARSLASHTSANAIRRDLVSASLIPPTSRRQVSAVKRRCIGSSFIKDKTACSKMFHGGPRRETIFRFWFLRRNSVFFSLNVAIRTLKAPRLCFTQDARPPVPRSLQASYRRSAWSRRSPHPHPLASGPQF